MCSHMCLRVCAWGVFVYMNFRVSVCMVSEVMTVVLTPTYTPTHAPTNARGCLFWLCLTVSDGWLTASADFCATKTAAIQLHTIQPLFLPVCHHRVSNSLRFASLTSPSQSHCTAASRGSRHTHTHHSTPRFFGRGEKRSKQSLDITTIFLRFLMESCCKIQKYLSKISVFLPCAESCFKEARSIILTKGICTTQPACQ